MLLGNIVADYWMVKIFFKSIVITLIKTLDTEIYVGPSTHRHGCVSMNICANYYWLLDTDLHFFFSLPKKLFPKHHNIGYFWYRQNIVKNTKFSEKWVASYLFGSIRWKKNANYFFKTFSTVQKQIAAFS